MAFILQCLQNQYTGQEHYFPICVENVPSTVWLLTTTFFSGSSIFSMFVSSIYVMYDHMQQTLLFLFLLCQLLPEVMPVCSLCETLLCHQLVQWFLISAMLFILWLCARPFQCRCALHGILLCFLWPVKEKYVSHWPFMPLGPRSQIPGPRSQVL